MSVYNETYEFECFSALRTARREYNAALNERDRAKDEMLSAQNRYMAYKRDCAEAKEALDRAFETWVEAGAKRDVE